MAIHPQAVRDESASNKELVLNWLKQGFPVEGIDPNIEIIIPGSPEGPIFGRHVGIEQFQQMLVALGEKVEQTFEIRDCLAENNQVVVFMEETLKPKANPNQSYLNRTAWLFRLNEEQKIVYIYTYDDTAVTTKALGFAN